MEFLYLLEGLRCPVLDNIFLALTILGEETVFLAVSIAVFWCVDKREGYFILMCGLVGTVINQGIKMIARIERPWILSPGFEPVGGAVKEATGYSFPSGHTQNAACTYGAIGIFSKRRWVKIAAAAVVILVAFSRMYLGVHTPMDVGTSLLIGCALLVVFRFLFAGEGRFERAMPFLVGLSALLSLGLLIYTMSLPETIVTPDTAELASYVKNLADTRDNAVTLFGCMLGLLLVYPLDRFVIKFDTHATWYANVIKVVVGALGVILVLKGLEQPIELFVGLFTTSPTLIATALRYFLTVAFAGVFWPLTFRFFSSMHISCLDSFAESIKLKLGKT